MGTELLAAGVPAGQCLEELAISRPELVQGLHEQYIAAGARVIAMRTAFNGFGADLKVLAGDEPMATLYGDQELERQVPSNVVTL